MKINIYNQTDINLIIKELEKTYTNVNLAYAYTSPQISFRHPKLPQRFDIYLERQYQYIQPFKLKYHSNEIIIFDINVIHEVVNKHLEKHSRKTVYNNAKKFNKDIFRLYVKGKFAELENVICKDNPKSSSLSFKIKIKRERIDDELKWEYFQKYTICAETSLKNYRADVEYEDVKLVVMDVTNHKECRPTIKEFFELYPNFDDMFNIKEKTK